MFYAYTRHSPGTLTGPPAPAICSGPDGTDRLALQPDLTARPHDGGWLVQSRASGGWCMLTPAEAVHFAPALAAHSLAPLAAQWSTAALTAAATHLAHCGLAAGAEPVASPPTPLALTFLTSTACNLACRYCYLALGPRPHPHTLPLATAFTAMQAAFAHPATAILFDFGEIAVDFPLVQQLILHAEALAAQHPTKQVRLAVQTNGTRLDSPTLDFLQTHAVTVGISLDGPAPVHDAARVTATHGRSHARCETGLRALIERRIPHIVLCTVTALNVGRAAELAAYFGALGVVDFSCKPVIRRGHAHTQWEALGVTVAEYQHFLDDLVTFAATTQQWNALDDRLARFLFRLLRDPRGWVDACPTPACGSGQRLFVVNPHGSVFACPRFATTDAATAPEPRPGLNATLADNLPAALRSAQAQPHARLDASLDAGCATCPWLAYCGGGCRLTAPDPLCPVYAHMYDLILDRVLPALGDKPSKLGAITVVNTPLGLTSEPAPVSAPCPVPGSARTA